MLQFVYSSPWHLPAVTVLSITVLFFALRKRVPFIVGFSICFGWLILLDAWANGAVTPIPVGARRPFEILFVVLGDWRLLLLFERYAGKALTLKGWIRSFFLAGVTGLLTIGYALATGTTSMRSIFLCYEILFFVFALILLFVVLPRMKGSTEENRSFAKAATHFVLIQYALWASADLLLINGFEWAMSLRLTANIFYYALFIPFVWWRAPDSPGRRPVLVPVAGLLAACLALSFVSVALNKPEPAPAAEAPAELNFKDGTQALARVKLPEIQALPVEQIGAFDPYYQHDKKWRAVSIENVLKTGFKRDPAQLVGEEFVLRASDGFAAYFPGKLLLEGGAYVAFEDLDVPTWEPIGVRKDNPGPFYLVWSKPEQQNLETHARPWQLASIELVTFDSQFPHVRPEGEVSAAATRGFQIFRTQCLACHAINRAGGKVGPELNVPRNILEYRDQKTIRAFIKDPQSFRYTVMPAHAKMTTEELDDLIAYFGVMKNQKNDKDAVKNAN